MCGMVLHTFFLLTTVLIHRSSAAPADAHHGSAHDAAVTGVPDRHSAVAFPPTDHPVDHNSASAAAAAGHADPHAAASAGHTDNSGHGASAANKGHGGGAALPQPSPATAASHDKIEQWGYETIASSKDELTPDHWSDFYPKCSGPRQSPIEIVSHSAMIDNTLEPLEFFSYDRQPVATNWTVTNNGHAIQFSGKFAHEPELRHGSLGANYRFAQFHFHWGKSDARGSEHVVDGKRFPLELHLVHRKITETAGDAGRDSTGYSIVGVLFEVANETETPNIHMQALTEAVQLGIYPTVQLRTIPNLNLIDLIPEHQSYYRYLGSLTTPPCHESVVWNILKTPLKMTEAQLNVFRSLHRHAGITTDEDLLLDNYRPIQKQNGRVVRFCPDKYDQAHALIPDIGLSRSAARNIKPGASEHVSFAAFLLLTIAYFSPTKSV
ncbi:putative Carbonic anhydrase 2 [Hypsibius exemplaris]|uniref:Carbonic anhydrase n=1 Tax=Hypsibius exemplaris TaxID=2072580 RepID=A0A1W0WK90_HYPEX|nr:putative Carbonic anhydrase 2 [Hypsibius exemplaris]